MKPEEKFTDQPSNTPLDSGLTNPPEQNLNPSHQPPQPPTQENHAPSLANSHNSPSQHQASSHVTSAPEHSPGQNFDPRIRAQYSNEPKVVHTTRSIAPAHFEISEELKKKNESSKKMFPFLNLSEGEYVILDIRRHTIGLISRLATSFMIITCFMVGLAMYPSDTKGAAQSLGGEASSMPINLPSFNSVAALLICLMVVVALGGFVSVWTYLQNRFIMTNESIIQEIQLSLMSRREQTVTLGSIEDASFKKTGIMQTMFDYGSIRLSTEGDETTYQFTYVANPKKQVAVLNNAIESFKNGRPVSDEGGNVKYN